MSDYTEYGSRYAICEWCDWVSGGSSFDISDIDEEVAAAARTNQEALEHLLNAHPESSRAKTHSNALVQKRIEEALEEMDRAPHEQPHGAHTYVDFGERSLPTPSNISRRDETAAAMTTFNSYPCNQGTSQPMGWHHFEFSNGVSVCRLCGTVASQPTLSKSQDRRLKIQNYEDPCADCSGSCKVCGD